MNPVRASGILWIVAVLFFSGKGLCAEKFTFDPGEIEKKPTSFNGFLELRPELIGSDRDAALYRIKFFNEDLDAVQKEGNFLVRMEGSYEEGSTLLYARVEGLLRHDAWGWDKDAVLQEAHATLKSGVRTTLQFGKSVVPWGKGYAFNPVSFVSRPRDPQDPTEAREGYYLGKADLVRTFDGALQALAFTPVVIPVEGNLNEDFGRDSHLNAAAKLYLLILDTDLDLMFLAGGSRPDRYGLDFSKNLATNFEVHGEAAWISDFEKKSLDRNGNVTTRKADIIQSLLGLRYLTASDVTFILEYYHNGGGLDRDSTENFYTFVEDAYDRYGATGDATKLIKAARTSRGTVAAPQSGRDYLYARASWKEPFDILYLTPALTTIVNLQDRSLSVLPEFLYTPRTNLELRLRGTILVGPPRTEYGEKQSDYKVELRARVYF